MLGYSEKTVTIKADSTENNFYSMSEIEDTNKINEVRSKAGLHSMITDVTLTQYSNQWSRVGNLQTSAGSLLAVISIAISVGFSNIPNEKDFLDGLSRFSMYGFLLSFIMAVVYFVLSVVFMIFILQSKRVSAVKNPIELINDIDRAIMDFNAEEERLLYVSDYLINIMEHEIKNVEEVLARNRYWYTKCLISAFLSLGASLALLLFTKISILTSAEFLTAFIGLLGYLFALSIILIFLFPRRIKQ